MLRSMIIGLAIAAMLQTGVHAFASAPQVSLAAKRIDWVTVQAKAVTKLVCEGYAFFVR